MSKLGTLQSKLNRLRHRRLAIRWGTGYSTLVTGILWFLAFAFAVDLAFEMDTVQHVVALVGIAFAAAWVFHRYTRPWLGHREDQVDVALMVERQQDIDSDLVAAIQFEESSEADAWGSEQLEGAVVDYVDDFSSSLDVFHGMSYRQLVRRSVLASVTVAAVVAVVLAFPDYAAAFFNRLLLGRAHYPTDTILESIRVNGQPVFSRSDDDFRPSTRRLPYGKPVTFEVAVSGVIPEAGRIELHSVAHRVNSTVELVKTGRRENATVFAGQVPRLVDSLSYQTYLGDAWTDPGRITVVPLPVVSVDLTPIPPDYATAASEQLDPDQSARQIAVIEGSEVRLRVRCTNKRLRRAFVTIDETKYPLEPVGGDRQVWKIKNDRSPFRNVKQSLRYQVEVEDEDGLALEQPIKGYIRIKADRPPRIAASLPSELDRVLPNATPKIVYSANDDYGLSKLQLKVQIVRKDGTSEEKTEDVAAVSGAEGPQRSLRGVHALDVSSFALEKGDELKLAFEAVDYRGDRLAESTISESIVLRITDLQGFLDGMLKTDEKSARKLDAIIRRELGIGDSP